MLHFRMDFTDSAEEIMDVLIEQKLKENPQRPRRMALKIIGIFLIIYGAFIAVRFFYLPLMIVVGIACAAAGAYAIFWQSWNHFKKMMKKATQRRLKLQGLSAFAQKIDYTFSDAGIESRSQYSANNMSWDEFNRWGKDGNYLYINNRGNSMILIDIRQITEEEAQELEGILIRNLGEKTA